MADPVMAMSEELSHDELCDIVTHIQELMYLDTGPRDDGIWDPDKEWDCASDMSSIAEKLREYKMVPTKKFEA